MQNLTLQPWVVLLQCPKNVGFADENDENGDCSENIQNVEGSPIPKDARAGNKPGNEFENVENSHYEKEFEEEAIAEILEEIL